MAIFASTILFSLTIVHGFELKLTVRGPRRTIILNDTPLKKVSSFQVDATKNKVATNFYSMVNRFSSYTDDDIKNLENERLRQLVFGGISALDELKVVQAFCVLYEDILPVRLGGDILFNMLDKAIVNARNKKSSYIERNIATNARSDTNSKQILSKTKQKLLREVLLFSRREDQIGRNCDTIFAEIDKNKDNTISLEEFESWIESVIITDSEENETLEELEVASLNSKVLFNEIDINNDGSISPEEFSVWTTGSNENECEVQYEDLPTSTKTVKYRERYLHMVRSFAKWGKAFASNNENTQNENTKAYSEDNRLNIIISGCFAGAENPGVVKALGILYEDYLPLRLAGDVVFKLVERQMG
eukprot:gene8618-17780_t